MKVVELNPDDVLTFLTNTINDIRADGVIPGKAIILTDEFCYCTDMSADEKKAMLLDELIDLCLPEEE